MDTQLLAIFYTLLLVLIVAMAWSIRDQNAKTHQILREVQASSERIARYLGSDRS
jgi:hypothetical protein